jgi:S1-C subfamily serine protease
MSIIDLVLILACFSFAFAGYRQGFLIGFFSFTGFLFGGVLGIWLAPKVVRIVTDDLGQAIFAVALVLGLATVGQLAGSALGAFLRGKVVWQPGHLIDAGAGAVLGVISLLLVAWFVGSALATAPIPNVTEKVKRSEVLAFVDRFMPDRADKLYSSLSRVLDKNGLTQVFRPFDNEKIIQVPEPSSGPLVAPEIRAAAKSVVKVEGAALSCRKALEGTGFVYAPQHVMTNAHVVAGVDAPTVAVGGGRDKLPARVVLFDDNRDVAILYVPGLTAPALQFDYTGERRADAVVAGFPLNGPYRLESARIRQKINARGPDIYDSGTVDRAVFSIFARVEPGNSGGPLLSAKGKVYGLIFAKSVTDTNTGYALTAEEVRSDAVEGAQRFDKVSTKSCV